VQVPAGSPSDLWLVVSALTERKSVVLVYPGRVLLPKAGVLVYQVQQVNADVRRCQLCATLDIVVMFLVGSAFLRAFRNCALGSLPVAVTCLLEGVVQRGRATLGSRL
jgi:diaminopimelate decarboxylase